MNHTVAGAVPTEVYGPAKRIHLTTDEAQEYINNPVILQAVCARFKFDNQRHKLGKVNKILLELELCPELRKEVISLAEQARKSSNEVSRFLYDTFDLHFQIQDAIRRYIGYEIWK